MKVAELYSLLHDIPLDTEVFVGYDGTSDFASTATYEDWNQWNSETKQWIPSGKKRLVIE